MKRSLSFVALTVLFSAMILGCSQGESQDSQGAVASLKVQVRTEQMKKLAGQALKNVSISFVEISATEVTVLVQADSSISGDTALSGSCTYELRSDEGRWVIKSATSEIGGNTCAANFTLP